MNNPTRREMLVGLLALSPSLPLLAAEEVWGIEPAVAPDAETYASARWTEEDGFWALRFGWETRSSAAEPSRSPTYAVLERVSVMSPTKWTVRMNGMGHQIEADNLADAKKHAELMVVQWLRQWLIKLEQLAFSLTTKETP